MYIKRNIEKKIKALAKSFPVVTILGPRQSGKTTLARNLFPKHKYINFEDVSIRNIAMADPKGFLLSQGNKVIFDEFQKIPELASEILIFLEGNKSPGQFILTGSENLSLTQTVSQSLSGRSSISILYGLTYEELEKSKISFKNPWEYIHKGSYPGIYSHHQDPNDWYSSYITTYIERDVRNIKNIDNLDSFQKFLKLLCGRTSQIINDSNLASEVGVSYKTISSWISIIEASFLGFKVLPYLNNYNKRIIRSPKFYFSDTGLATWLLNIRQIDSIWLSYMSGALFENLIISEIHKFIHNNGLHTQIYFYKDSNNLECDCIIEWNTKLYLIEIKSTQTIKKELYANLLTFKKLDKNIDKLYLIYGGDQDYKLSDISIVSWKNLDKALKEIFNLNFKNIKHYLS